MLHIRLIAATLLAASLTACASQRFEADVVRFHKGYTAEAATVALRPADPALAQTLEFRQYADIISSRLARHGFRPAGTTGQADLTGEIAYNVTTREALRDGRSPVSVGVGVGGVGSHVGVSLGTVFGLGGKDKGGTRVYNLSLRLIRPGGETVWEGRTSAEVSVREGTDLASVLPVLTDALLSNFPGPSGQSTRYVAPTRK